MAEKHTTFLKFLNKSPMFSFSSTNKNNLIEYEIYYQNVSCFYNLYFNL